MAQDLVLGYSISRKDLLGLRAHKQADLFFKGLRLYSPTWFMAADLQNRSRYACLRHNVGATHRFHFTASDYETGRETQKGVIPSTR
jgi:hypothetical protein